MDTSIDEPLSWLSVIVLVLVLYMILANVIFVMTSGHDNGYLKYLLGCAVIVFGIVTTQVGIRIRARNTKRLQKRNN